MELRRLFAGICKIAQIGYVVNPHNLFSSFIFIGRRAISVTVRKFFFFVIAGGCQGNHVDFIIACLDSVNTANPAVLEAIAICCIAMCMELHSLCRARRSSCNREGIRSTKSVLILHRKVEFYIIIGVPNNLANIVTPVRDIRGNFLSNRCMLHMISNQLALRSGIG